MKVFCDTNVLIAAFLANHPQHYSARPVIERIKSGVDKGSIGAHSLAEVYAVITRLPGTDRVPPNAAWQLLSQNAIGHFSIISLSAKEYATTIQETAANGAEGGKVYDALILAAAAKSGAERIFTFNVHHFQNLAADNLRKRIVAP